jgi:O-antigen ligase
MILLLAAISFMRFKGSSGTEVFTRIESSIVFFLPILIIKEIKQLERTLRLWVYSAAGVMVVVIIQPSLPFDLTHMSRVGRELGDYQIPFTRRSGLFEVYSYLGSYVAIGYVFSLIGALRGKVLQVTKSKLSLSLMIILAGVFLTQSRSTWMAFLVGTIVTCVIVYRPGYERKEVKMLKQVTFIFLLVLIVLAPIANPFSFVDRSVTWVMEMNPTNVHGRLDQVKVGLDLWLESPLLGSGKDSFKQASPTGSLVLHNMWINILVQHGLVGLLVFVTVFLIPVLMNFSILGSRRWGKKYRYISSGLIGGIACISIEESFAPGLAHQSIWLALGVANAFPEILRREAAEERGSMQKVARSIRVSA